jgi:hypothetical protein
MASAFVGHPVSLIFFIVFIRSTYDCVAFNQCVDVAVDMHTFKINPEHFVELLQDSAAILPEDFTGSLEHGI